MTNTKANFLAEIENRFGTLSKLERSKSLFKLQGSDIRIYIRYSKIHGQGKTFYGLRDFDLKNLQGYPSVLCFLWDGQEEPLIVPFSDFEEIFSTVEPAGDGQYKCQVVFDAEATELYIARAGRFNVEGYFGWQSLIDVTQKETYLGIPSLSHSQVQTLLGAIGASKKMDIWIPLYDRMSLDWSVAGKFAIRGDLPQGYETIGNVLQEIDVIWLNRGSNQISALFEVEHSTPIYSGLLRFNDIHLVSPNKSRRYSIVSNDARHSLFVRQINRPTFKASGISEACNFLEYANVYNWYKRIVS